MVTGPTTVRFDYSLQQEVTIIALKAKGFVTGLLKDGDNLNYRVVYWWDGVRKSDWLYPHEITP